jgi:hypothetical protein
MKAKRVGSKTAQTSTARPVREVKFAQQASPLGRKRIRQAVIAVAKERRAAR